jgi:hypothetical protein
MSCASPQELYEAAKPEQGDGGEDHEMQTSFLKDDS